MPALAKFLVLPLALAAGTASAEWKYEEHPDKVAAYPIPTTQGAAPSVGVFCGRHISNSPGLFILLVAETRVRITSDTEYISASYQVDSAEAVSGTWFAGETNPGPDSVARNFGVGFAEAVPVARALASGTKLTFKATDSLGNDYTTQVQLIGSSRAIEKVMRTCNLPMTPNIHLDGTVWRFEEDVDGLTEAARSTAYGHSTMRSSIRIQCAISPDGPALLQMWLSLDGAFGEGVDKQEVWYAVDGGKRSAIDGKVNNRHTFAINSDVRPEKFFRDVIRGQGLKFYYFKNSESPIGSFSLARSEGPIGKVLSACKT